MVHISTHFTRLQVYLQHFGYERSRLVGRRSDGLRQCWILQQNDLEAHRCRERCCHPSGRYALQVGETVGCLDLRWRFTNLACCSLPPVNFSYWGGGGQTTPRDLARYGAMLASYGKNLKGEEVVPKHIIESILNDGNATQVTQ